MTVHTIFSNRKFISYNKIYHGVYFPGKYNVSESWFDELYHVEWIVRENGE